MSTASPYDRLSLVLEQYHDFLQADAEALLQLLLELLSKDLLAAYLNAIDALLRWFYEQLMALIELGDQLLTLTAAAEVTGLFVDGLLAIVRQVGQVGEDNPLSPLLQPLRNIGSVVPAGLDLSDWADKLNSLPQTQNLAKLQYSILLLTGTEGYPLHQLPATLPAGTGSLVTLRQQLT